MLRYDKNIVRLVVGFDILLVLLTFYQVTLVFSAGQLTDYTTIFLFWMIGFVGAIILTCALKYNVITFFAIPFFLPSIWFIMACLASYIRYPDLASIQGHNIFFLTIAFLIVYSGLILLSIHMGVKRSGLYEKLGVVSDSTEVEKDVES